MPVPQPKGAATQRDAGGSPKTKRLPGTLDKPINTDPGDWQNLGISSNEGTASIGLDAGRDGVEAIGAPESASAIDDDQEIKRLAGLSPIAYDREREAIAQQLRCRLTTLDKAVAARQGVNNEKQAVELCADIEPCAEPVDVAALLTAVRNTIRRFIVCEPHTATAATLWIAFTWVIDHVEVAPLAVITAPEKGCGKTQLLEVIGRLSRRALFASNISLAATFRVIEAKAPTLLIDEADSFFRENEQLRGIINSGHTRTSAYVIRSVGDEFEPRRFSTWGAKAIAGIGRLPETVMSRAIVLNLRRKTKDETVQRLRHANPSVFETLARMLARFGVDNAATISRSRPDLPEALGDRQQDNWEPLLAIADIAGGGWPRQARCAALMLSGAKEDEQSIGEQLLRAIRDAFEKDGVSKLSREELLRRLISDEEGPWATLIKGQPITAAELKKKLGTYGIHAKKVRLNAHATGPGFERSQFAEPWSRYLDGGETSSGPLPENPNSGTMLEIQAVGCSRPVPDATQDRNTGTAACSDVPFLAVDEDGIGTPNALKSEQCSAVPVERPPSGRDMPESEDVEIEL